MYRLLCLELNQDIWTLSRHPKAHPLSKQIRLSSHFFFFFSVDGTEEMTCHHTKMTNYLSNVSYTFSWTCHEPNVMLLACFTARWTCPLLTQTLPYPVPRRLFLVLSYPTSSRLPFLLDIKNDIGSNVTL